MSFSPSDVITVGSSLFPIVREDMTRTLTIEVMIGKKMTSRSILFGGSLPIESSWTLMISSGPNQLNRRPEPGMQSQRDIYIYEHAALCQCTVVYVAVPMTHLMMDCQSVHFELFPSSITDTKYQLSQRCTMEEPPSDILYTSLAAARNDFGLVP